jgi:hypothetical protein
LIIISHVIMNPLQQSMPSLFAHQGVWEGRYRIVNLQGDTLDQHRSRIEVNFPETGPHYLQRNHFSWDDGRELKVEHPGFFRDGMLRWNTEHIEGAAWEAGERCIVLRWRRPDTPGSELTELIALGEGAQHRARTWHWFRDGVCYQRTLIDEQRVTA